MAAYIKTLRSNNGDQILPRTSSKAIYTEEGYTLEEQINQLITEKIEQIPTPDVSGQIQEHNDDEMAHENIRSILNDKAPMYTYGTEDLEAGVSPLEAGKLYFVYK